MRRNGLFSRLKAIFFGTAVFALFSFGFQSVALPVHASTHELRRIVHAGPSYARYAPIAADSTHIVEGDCALCDLAAHQSIQSAAFVTFTVVDSIALREECLRAEVRIVRPTLLPPARGPPARA